MYVIILMTVKALHEIKASLGWRVVYGWVGDDPLPAWSGVTCSPVSGSDYRVGLLLNWKCMQFLSLVLFHSHNLRWNKLQDSIPPEIGELKQLTHLYIEGNSFRPGVKPIGEHKVLELADSEFLCSGLGSVLTIASFLNEPHLDDAINYVGLATRYEQMSRYLAQPLAVAFRRTSKPHSTLPFVA
ncbi:hypothetical protein SASPL_144245 [Salvia splendens]|uniref:Uncharacterized protein n=1 Tax=Salvia splendens TaxID=180675 RepID=A0A8X8ZBB1_SALSN|nr:hypothetical protein SASPL_144245 [Salvia splendens]